MTMRTMIQLFFDILPPHCCCNLKNYHKLSDPKATQAYYTTVLKVRSPKQAPVGSKGKVSAGLQSFQRLWGESIFLPFSASRDCLSSQAFPSYKSAIAFFFLSHTHNHFSFTLKDTPDYTGPIWIIQSISYLRSEMVISEQPYHLPL